jgi:hypothetical protein
MIESRVLSVLRGQSRLRLSQAGHPAGRQPWTEAEKPN